MLINSGNSGGLYQFQSGNGLVNVDGVVFPGIWTASGNGRNNVVNINPIIAQSGNAAFTALLISPTISSTGAGPNYLIDVQTGNVDKFNVTQAGNVGIGIAIPAAKLEVSGTISATNLVVNGVSITGTAASADRIVSGSVNMIAEQTSGTVRISGTLAMQNTGNEVCGPATWYSFRVDPVSGQMQMCRP